MGVCGWMSECARETVVGGGVGKRVSELETH